MNIFTMLGSKNLTIGNVIKFSNYKSSVLHTELRVSTLVLFIILVHVVVFPCLDLLLFAISPLLT